MKGKDVHSKLKQVSYFLEYHIYVSNMPNSGVKAELAR
jgi:hypothetical protein